MKNHQIFIVALFFSSFLLLSNHTFSQVQDVTGSDLSKVQVDQLTDDQVQTIVDKAELSGMTPEQIEVAAKAKGMSSSEILKLKTRIANLKISSNENKDEVTDQTDNTESVNDPVAKTTNVNGEIFGFSLFTNKTLSFEPSTNIATPSNYQLGPGDKLAIDVWGASQETYTPKITAEGNIIISNVGPIYISGMTIEEATIKIKKELGLIYSGLYTGETYMKISLSAVRSIKVNIVGDVAVPGTYTLSSLSNVFNAMYLAGGPAVNGSLRDVKIIRNNKTTAELDFYEFLMNGELPGNMRLQDEDVIFVSTYTKRVQIKGEVKRPLLYDLKANETLKDLIYYAGDYTGTAYSNQIQITRKTGKDYKVFDVLYDQQDTFKLKNGDVISVNPILEIYRNRVEIKGAVMRPGIYAIDSTLTLGQLIIKAEGLQGDVFKNRISVYRLLPDLTTEVIPLDLTDSSHTYDFLIQKEDLVVVSSIFDITEEYNIGIEGEVKSPGKYPFTLNTTVEDLIIQAGGLLESASCAHLEVARRIKNDTTVTSTNQLTELYQFQISKDLKLADSTSKFILKPFDQIYIRKSPAYSEQSVVTVEGQVLFPGSYSLTTKDERISDIIKRCGNVTPEAYIKGARLIRKLTSIQSLQINDLKKLKARVGDSLELATDLGKTESTIGINLEKILKHPGSYYDLFLQKGDVLKIPKTPQTVDLNGALLFPNVVRFIKGQRLRKYIYSAGGFTNTAKPSMIYVLNFNGSVKRTHKILFFNSYPRIEPGAEIIVPEKPEHKRMTSAEAAGFGTAMASLALIIISILNALKL